jgi:hypothetical protein
MSQINPIHPIQSYSSKIHFNMSTNLRLGLDSGVFPSGFPTNIPYAVLFPHSCYMPCPSCPPWLDRNYTRWRVQVMKLIMTFSPTSCHSISSAQIFSSATLFSKTLDLCSPLMSETKFHIHTEPQAKLLFCRWVPCHHGMAGPQVADGRDALQVWRVAANILNKQSRTADRGWSSSFGVARGAKNSP